MNKIVNIVKNNDGQTVTPYAKNAAFGYITIKCTMSVSQNGWMQEKVRTANLRGKTEQLIKWFGTSETLPGSIRVTECIEDNIPADCMHHLNATLPKEEQIAKFIKTAGEDGPVLISGGQRILRFTDYDPSGAQPDIKVMHENGDEIRAFNAQNKKAEAKL